MNIANFRNIFTDIYTYIMCDEHGSKQKRFNKLNTAAGLLAIIFVSYFLL